MVMHACNPGTWEVDERGSGFSSQSQDRIQSPASTRVGWDFQNTVCACIYNRGRGLELHGRALAQHKKGPLVPSTKTNKWLNE